MESVRLPSDGPVSIGRAEGSSLRLDDSSVAEHHAMLYPGTPPTLCDLGSGQPTMVRAERLVPGVPFPVTPGTIMTIGGVVLALQSTGPSARLRHIRSHDYFEG